MMIKYCFFAAALAVAVNTVYSQSLPFINYDSKDGLSSSNVFSIAQDPQGYIWFATKAGISRFNAHTFVNFNSNNGLNSNDIINVSLGSDGTLYFTSTDKGISVFKNGKIDKYQLDNSEIIRPHDAILRNDTLYIYGDFLFYIYNHSLTKLYSIPGSVHGAFPDNFRLHFLANTSYGIIAATSKGLYVLKNNRFEKITVNGLMDKDYYSICEDKASNLWLCSDSKIYSINNGIITNTINLPLPGGYDASKIFVDSFGRVWLGFLNKGLYILDNGKLVNIGKKTGIEKFAVSSIKEDREGNVWLTSLGKGVFCFHHMYVNTFSEADGLSNNAVKEINMDSTGRILAGTFDGFNMIDNGNLINFKTGFENKWYTYIYDIKTSGNNVYAAGNFAPNKNTFGSINNNGINFINAVFASFEVRKNYLFAGEWGNSVRIINRFNNFRLEKIVILEGNTQQNVRVNKIFLDKDGGIWVATSNGIFILDSNFNSSRFNKKEIDSLSIIDIGQDKKNNLWFIGSTGVYLYEMSEDSILEFKNFKGRDFIAATSFAVDMDNRIWIGTTKGISRIQYEKDDFSVSHYGMNIGLPSNEVAALFYDSTRNEMWAGTSAGISSIALSGLDKETPPTSPVTIEKILVNDSASGSSHNFSMDQKSRAHIVFSALNYSNSDDVVYEYKFDGTPGEWQETKETTLNFAMLESGDYRLLIRANFGNGSVTVPAVVEFNVKPNFYQTLYFYIAVILAGTVVSIFFIYRRVKIHYKREGERAGYRAVISELKQQSLASMMNPHFIFNSLNSIQSFINKYEKDSANEYLAKFAHLIRLNLNKADKTFILLNDEIERLELYLSLEKLRFGDSLDYDIFVASDIDPAKTLIPNMIIQPFVENAILHGINPSGRNGLININIFHAPMPNELKENYVAIYNQSLHASADNMQSEPGYCIKIVVEDNGIGINEARKLRQSKHVSRGLQIIRERLSVLHHYSGKDDLVTILDKIAEGESTPGTRVEIVLSPNIYSVQSG